MRKGSYCGSGKWQHSAVGLATLKLATIYSTNVFIFCLEMFYCILSYNHTRTQYADCAWDWHTITTCVRNLCSLVRQRNRNLARNMRLVWTLIFVLIFVCWIPYYVMYCARILFNTRYFDTHLCIVFYTHYMFKVGKYSWH